MTKRYLRRKRNKMLGFSVWPAKGLFGPKKLTAKARLKTKVRNSLWDLLIPKK